jgi:peptide chain release factor subunit 1
MKITLALPQGKQFKQRLLNEIAVAENIKDKDNRAQITTGLRKIVLNYQEGKVFLYDGNTEELVAYDYKLKDFIYHCGDTFVTPNDTSLRDLENKYILIAMDANNATIGILQGKKVTIIWDKDSHVPRKHDAGGQSQRRFERGRAEALKRWLKDIGKKIEEIVR